MSSLDSVKMAARQEFELQFIKQDMTRTPDGQYYVDGFTENMWTAYCAGYVRATSRFQATFVGHVYVKDEEFAALVAGQAK